MSTIELSDNELAAIESLKENGGCMLLTNIPDKSGSDVFGFHVAGKSVYKKLEKMGLVFLTDETSEEDGFDWTPSYCLVEKDRIA